MNYKLSLFAISQIRQLASSPLNRPKSHYDSLGVLKTATQAEVKNAYYKLSKVYHPDRNRGKNWDEREVHSQKFRDITEAYEVLGNVRTRRMYDKGFLSQPPTPRHQTPDDPLHKFYKSREQRTKPPNPSGRQPIYDFDEWSRQHYAESVRKAKELKERRAFHAAQAQSKEEKIQQELGIYLAIMIFIIMAIFKEAKETRFTNMLFTEDSGKKNFVDKER